MIKINSLRCNSLESPLGVDTPSPRLGWTAESEEPGYRQAAYRILVSENEENLSHEIGECWDTGKIFSGRNTFIEYRGKALKSHTEYCWKVCVWPENTENPVWSGTARWETGLFGSGGFCGNWIAAPEYADGESADAAPLFRKSFFLDGGVRSARAYICGLGFYELTVNGRKTGGSVLAPAFTKYDSTVLYDTYDITGAFHGGENVVGVVLGNGFYNSSAEDAWDFCHAPWRDRPKFLLQIYIELENGKTLAVKSDKRWLTAPGPIGFNQIRNGERYDARRERDGWDRPGFDASGWRDAVIARSPGGILKSQQMPPEKVTEILRPVAVRSPRPGVYIFDFGRNLSGWARFSASGPSGAEIVFRYAEKLAPDGSADRAHIGQYVTTGEFQTDRYVMKGGGRETWEPRFVYHGFRYIEMSGFPGKPDDAVLRACCVHTAFEERGGFSCSSGLFNTLQILIKRSTLTNYHGIPTDCPHREKNGWTGDAQLSSEQFLLNYNPETAYYKWMDDLKDAQRSSGQLPGIVPTGGWGYNWGSGPAWDCAVAVIPWNLYLYRGDVGALAGQYDAIRRYVDFMTRMSDGHIVNFGLGDWCPPSGTKINRCPTEVSDTAIYYSVAVILRKAAELLGKTEDAEKYGRLAEEIKEAFRENFIDESTGSVRGNCQTSMACALYHGLAGGRLERKVFEALTRVVEANKCSVDFGILGAKYILTVLTKYGRSDLAFRIASRTEYPSWGFWVRSGATTLWETWEGSSSQNHHMFSSIGDWFYTGVAGLMPDEREPGFRHIILRPHPAGDLTWAKAWHESPFGRIETGWKLKDGRFILTAEIPANCTASVYLPPLAAGEVSVAGGTARTDFSSGDTPVSLASGRYTVAAALSRAR